MADNTLLLLAEAEKERRRRLAQRDVASGGNSTPAQKQATLGQNVNEFVAGVARPLAKAVDFAMSPVSAAREAITGRPSPEGLSGMVSEAGAFSGNPQSIPGTAGEYVGMALPMAMGAASLGSVLPRGANIGPVQTFLDNIAKTAFSSPRTYLASEGMGAAGAGAMAGVARQAGAGQGGQFTAELVGSLAGGLPTMVQSGMRGVGQGLTASLAPMTNEGGMIRAARQTQQRAGGQEAAVAASNTLESIPGGVTPAQWIGDERLMAQEARMLADNPEMANIVRADLQGARIAAQESLLDSFGKPRTRQDWERSVLERVAPPGTKITPAMTDEMLDEAYQAFTPLYDKAKGVPVNVSGLDAQIATSSRDPEIIATDAERGAVGGWLGNQFTAIQRRVLNGQAQSDDLIELRSRVRDERRSQTKRGNMERADLLGSAEAVITKSLEEQLPEEAVNIIRAADSQYRKYKVVENAIFSAGDSALTPQQLSDSIRSGGLTTTSSYARGTDPVVQELRIAALGGRSTQEVLGDPRRAQLFVRGLDDESKKAVQADFVGVLYNRAKDRATDATDAGVALISGQRLMQDIAENKNVMSALGMSPGEIGRVETIAREITKLERRAPAAVASLFEDGPASIIELVFTLFGAKSGQRLAGNGLGSSMVLAQYMSNKARGTLSNITADEATRLMNDAVRDPKLYRAILTKDIVDPRRNREAAQYLESWLLASAADKALAEEE